MSKIRSKLRAIAIRIKRKKRAKIKKLAVRYAAAKHHDEQQRVLEKIKKVSPQYPIERLETAAKTSA